VLLVGQKALSGAAHVKKGCATPVLGKNGGLAFTRACAQIPPRARNADIAVGNGLSDTFSMSPEPATR